MTGLWLALWLVCAGASLWIAAQDVGLATQAWLALSALGCLLVLRLFKPSGLLRLFVLLLAAFVTVRYLGWRTFYSLPPVDSSGFVPGLILYLAELHAIVLYFLGMFANVAPLQRRTVRLPTHLENYPTVDVFITTYNEPEEILQVTLTAARHIRYPASKINVFLLDDGGTDEKLFAKSPGAARAAHERAARLQALCGDLGVRYLTRRSNAHAKAGNINAALTQTRGDLILVLDADHVPAQDILEETVGLFLRDPGLALVQTPHFFVNPDPVERNLGTFYMMPSESEMFYQAVQKGLDFWNSAMFCGSAAVLRRRHLMRVGGIATASVTEDALTSLELHAAGFTSAYVDRPVVAGLAPETFESFVTQRTRWAQGMVQILLLRNPLFKRGLTPAQRLCYLNSCLFWLSRPKAKQEGRAAAKGDHPRGTRHAVVRARFRHCPEMSRTPPARATWRSGSGWPTFVGMLVGMRWVFNYREAGALGAGGKRRRWPAAVTRELVAATFALGASAPVVARRHELNAKQLLKWQRQFEGSQ